MGVFVANDSQEPKYKDSLQNPTKCQIPDIVVIIMLSKSWLVQENISI